MKNGEIGERREKKEKEDMSVSSALHLPEVLWCFFAKKKKAPARGSDPKKGKARSTLHNFFQLTQALAFQTTQKKTKKNLSFPCVFKDSPVRVCLTTHQSVCV